MRICARNRVRWRIIGYGWFVMSTETFSYTRLIWLTFGITILNFLLYFYFLACLRLQNRINNNNLKNQKMILKIIKGGSQ